MEGDLDKIADGDKKKIDVLRLFWSKFHEDLDKQDGVKEKKVALKTESNEIDIDGQKYMIRIAKFGPVIQYIKPGAANKVNAKGKEEPTYTYIPLKGYLQLILFF